jgi:hypothetical protein
MKTFKLLGDELAAAVDLRDYHRCRLARRVEDLEHHRANMLRFFVQCLATLDTCIANPDSSSKSIADATECRSTVIIGVKQARNAEDYLETRVAHVRQAVTEENENIACLYALLHVMDQGA